MAVIKKIGLPASRKTAIAFWYRSRRRRETAEMRMSLLSLPILLLVLASLTSSSSKGTSIQDPHSRELHGTSTRKLLEKMVAAGGGQITDSDIGVLFLR